MKRALLGLGALSILVTGLALAACGDDGADDGSSGDAGVIAAINILDKAGLHDLDTSINTDNTIPDDARTTALRLQTVVLLTTWPDVAKDEATKLAQIFGELAAKLDSSAPDVKAVGVLAHDAHEGAHDFSHLVWGGLQKTAGVAADTATEPAD